MNRKWFDSNEDCFTAQHGELDMQECNFSEYELTQLTYLSHIHNAHLTVILYQQINIQLRYLL